MFGVLVISLVAGGVVCVWLAIDPFDIPARGYVVLWAVAIVVLGTGAAELIALMRSRTG